METLVRRSGAAELLPPRVRTFLSVAARTQDAVMLRGETGTGKTVLARLIHALGPGAKRPFVEVNCAAIPATLFEAEMFGHAKGAFTDARHARAGLVEGADGGTLFLDEIGELPLVVQPKLLQVLEDGVLRRVGSTELRQARFRLVVATSRDLTVMLEQGTLRPDLYYRCAALETTLPPLRERRTELPRIVDRLLANGPGRTPLAFSAAAMELLVRYPWPGNLRELENTLRHAVAYAADGSVEPPHLPERVRRYDGAAAGASGGRRSRYHPPDDPEVEARAILEALEREGGNRTRAARRLGMSRATLWVKLRTLDFSDTK